MTNITNDLYIGFTFSVPEGNTVEITGPITLDVNHNGRHFGQVGIADNAPLFLSGVKGSVYTVEAFSEPKWW